MSTLNTPAQSSPAAAPVVVDPLRGTAGFLWTFRLCLYGLLIVAIWVGGPVFKLAGGAGILLAILADWSGAVRHILHLIWLPLSIAVIRLKGVPLAEWAAAKFSLPSPIALGVAGGMIVLAGVVVSSLIGAIITAGLRKRRYLHVLNHAGGAVLGVGEGIALAAVVSWLLAIFGPTIVLHAEAAAAERPQIAKVLNYVVGVRTAFRNDPAGQWLDENNALEDVPAVMTAAAVAELTVDTDYIWEMASDGTLQDALQDPVIRAYYMQIRADEQVSKALDRRDLSALLRSRHFTRALNDDELCKAVARQWPQLRKKIPASKVAEAHRIAGTLEGAERAKVNRALRRAEQFGIKLDGPAGR